MNHKELQEQARRKLDWGTKSDTRIIKYTAIHDLTLKTEPLTDADVAQLEHFINSSIYTLKNTVYHANSIISPVTTNIKLHKITVKNS